MKGKGVGGLGPGGRIETLPRHRAGAAQYELNSSVSYDGIDQLTVTLVKYGGGVTSLSNSIQISCSRSVGVKAF